MNPDRWPAGPPWRVALCLAQQKAKAELRLLRVTYFFGFTVSRKMNRLTIPIEARNLSLV